MGNEKSTPKQPVQHEEIVKIVNVNVRQSEHTANAVTILEHVSLT